MQRGAVGLGSRRLRILLTARGIWRRGMRRVACSVEVLASRGIWYERCFGGVVVVAVKDGLERSGMLASNARGLKGRMDCRNG